MNFLKESLFYYLHTNENVRPILRIVNDFNIHTIAIFFYFSLWMNLILDLLIQNVYISIRKKPRDYD